jgi:hypothetical protein
LQLSAAVEGVIGGIARFLLVLSKIDIFYCVE